MKKLLSLFVLFNLLVTPGAHALDDYQPADEENNAENNYILDADDSGGDITLQFGATLAEYLKWNDVNSRFELSDSLDLLGESLVNARIHPNAGNPSTCDVNNTGRIYYDTVADSTYVCEETTPSVYAWVDLTTTAAATSSKVVTVGTGQIYTTIAAAAGYLNSLTGGFILLTPEVHSVTTAVDLEGIMVIGSNPEQSIIDVNGAGVLDVKDTIFENLTIDVDAALTANAAMDVQYDASTTSSVYFSSVDLVTGGTKFLIESTEATAPTAIVSMINPSAQSGTASVVDVQASSGLNTGSSKFLFSSQGESGALDMSDWDITIAGASNVVTTGSITTTPADTIFVYPGMNIQEALNSLTNGGVVTLLPGTHGITSTLTIDNDGVTLQGYGDASIIEATGFSGIGTTTAAIQIGAVGGGSPATNVTLKDFKLEVNNTDIHGIRAAGGTDIRLFNLNIEKTAGTSGSGTTAKLGILLMDGTATQLVRPVIKNTRVSGAAGRWFTDGIHVSGEGATAGLFGNGNGVVSALVESSSVDYVGETAAAFVHVTDSSLFNNRFSNMGGAGGGAYGLYMGRINRTSMANNIVSGSLSTASIAIGVESFNIGASPVTQNSVFSGNVIDGTGNGGVGFGTGFQVGATTGTTVQNNTFQQNKILGASTATTTAFLARGNFDKNIISTNTISGGANAWDTGIDINVAAANENTIRGNDFDNVTTAISDNGTDTKLGVAHHRATSDPTVNNDIDEGYSVGTIWVNTSSNTAYISVDDASGAADWNQIDGAGGGGHTQNTDTGTTSEDFTLDTDDTGGDLTLTFGTTLAETLSWIDASARFEFSDDLRVNGNLATVGQEFTAGDHAAADSDGVLNLGRNANTWETLTFDATTDDRFEFSDDLAVSGNLDIEGNQLINGRIENLASAPTCDAAAQGRLYNNTTSNNSFVCNGSSWQQIDGGGGAGSVVGDLPAVQARNTVPFSISNGSYADVTFNATDIENDVATLDHDNTNTDRVNITTGGLYQISYAVMSEKTAGGGTAQTDVRVRVNDSTVLNGSDTIEIKPRNEYSIASKSFIASLSDSDFLSLQLQGNDGNLTTVGDVVFTVVRLAPSEITSITGTDSETFTVDADDTGGDLSLTFGTTLAETLSWIDASARFEFSDDLAIGGNVAVEGTQLYLDDDNAGAGVNVDIIANQGSDSDGTLRYDATANAWQISNDGGSFTNIPVPSVFYAYDATGGQAVTGTEITLNIDTSVVADPNYSLASDQVTVTEAGLYRIAVNTGYEDINTAGAARTSVEVRVQENGVDIPGAVSRCYYRETENQSCATIFLENVAAGGVLRVRLQRIGGATNVQTLAGSSRLIIEKIR